MERHEHHEILFLSGIYPAQLYDELTDLKMNGNVQIAADVLQKQIIQGLDNLIPTPVTLVNAPYIGVFPRGSKIVQFRRSTFSHSRGAEDINIHFWNIPLLRHFSIYHNSKREIRKWVKKHPNGTVMAYALTLRNIYALRYAKRQNKEIKTCMIVPDLPLYMRMSAGWAYRTAKKFENWLIGRNLERLDFFVLLTKHMNDVIKSRRYCVVEGIAASEETVNAEDEQLRIVLYTGTLDKKYGIGNLLQAFHQIKGDDIRLYICGRGDSQTAVEQMELQDKRICYQGLVSREKALQLQSRATVLVNPRQNTEEFTKYSFPSKNLEYLSSGVPLVAYKLDGIPDDYDPYIHYVKDNSIRALQETIEQVLNMPAQERRIFGEKAKSFVREHKNQTVQARKILDMIDRYSYREEKDNGC